jgi:type 1 glutamine amidotransferase
MGGYFETFWSVNPTWEADFKELPKHPITQGVKPFKIRDEWYYNMRFAPSGVTYILTAVPPDNTRMGKDDAHGGNEFVRNNKGRGEHLAWAVERPDGGRGFGFTGGHYHKNWGNEDFRRLVLNALLWSAKAEVPEGGVQSEISEEDLAKNLDEKK